MSCVVYTTPWKSWDGQYVICLLSYARTHRQARQVVAQKNTRNTTTANDSKQQHIYPPYRPLHCCCCLPRTAAAAVACRALLLLLAAHCCCARDNRIPAGRPAVRPPPLRFSIIMPNKFEESFKPAQGNPGGKRAHRHMSPPQIPQEWSTKRPKYFASIKAKVNQDQSHTTNYIPGITVFLLGIFGPDCYVMFHHQSKLVRSTYVNTSTWRTRYNMYEYVAGDSRGVLVRTSTI